MSDGVIEGTETAKAQFAFVVIKQPDGRIAIGNLENTDAEREPTIDDIYSAISVVQRDIQVQQTVGGVIQTLTQVGNRNANETKSGIVVPEPTSKFKKVVRT